MESIKSLLSKNKLEPIGEVQQKKLKGGGKGGVPNLGNSLGNRAKCPPPILGNN